MIEQQKKEESRMVSRSMNRTWTHNPHCGLYLVKHGGTWIPLRSMVYHVDHYVAHIKYPTNPQGTMRNHNGVHGPGTSHD